MDGRFSRASQPRDGTVSTPGSSAASASVSGTKSVAVILFNFSDDRSQPFTPSSVAQTYFAAGAADRSVANYYNEGVVGQVQLTGQAYGWYTIAASTPNVRPRDLGDASGCSRQRRGRRPDRVRLQDLRLSGVGSCGWGGLAQMPGNRNWINGSPTAGLMAHELGHNFGLNHAVSATCTLANGDRVPFGPNCTTSEYDDRFDVMGRPATTITSANGTVR